MSRVLTYCFFTLYALFMLATDAKAEHEEKEHLRVQIEISRNHAIVFKYWLETEKEHLRVQIEISRNHAIVFKYWLETVRRLDSMMLQLKEESEMLVRQREKKIDKDSVFLLLHTMEINTKIQLEFVQLENDSEKPYLVSVKWTVAIAAVSCIANVIIVGCSRSFILRHSNRTFKIRSCLYFDASRKILTNRLVLNYPSCIDSLRHEMETKNFKPVCSVDFLLIVRVGDEVELRIGILRDDRLQFISVPPSKRIKVKDKLLQENVRDAQDFLLASHCSGLTDIRHTVQLFRFGEPVGDPQVHEADRIKLENGRRLAAEEERPIGVPTGDLVNEQQDASNDGHGDVNHNGARIQEQSNPRRDDHQASSSTAPKVVTDGGGEPCSSSEEILGYCDEDPDYDGKEGNIRCRRATKV